MHIFVNVHENIKIVIFKMATICVLGIMTGMFLFQYIFL